MRQNEYLCSKGLNNGKHKVIDGHRGNQGQEGHRRPGQSGVLRCYRTIIVDEVRETVSVAETNSVRDTEGMKGTEAMEGMDIETVRYIEGTRGIRLWMTIVTRAASYNEAMRDSWAIEDIDSESVRVTGGLEDTDIETVRQRSNGR